MASARPEASFGNQVRPVDHTLEHMKRKRELTKLLPKVGLLSVAILFVPALCEFVTDRVPEILKSLAAN